MKVEYHRSFERDLRNVRDPSLLRRLKTVLLNLEEAEDLESLPGVKAMTGHPSYFRIRLGDYRLGFKRSGDGVRVIRFLSRAEIYRKFP